MSSSSQHGPEPPKAGKADTDTEPKPGVRPDQAAIGYVRRRLLDARSRTSSTESARSRHSSWRLLSCLSTPDDINFIDDRSRIPSLTCYPQSLLNRGPQLSSIRHFKPSKITIDIWARISSRSFKRTFSLADHVQVKGANFENGLLKIELVREVPDAMKPRRIGIRTSDGSGNKQIDQKKAA